MSLNLNYTPAITVRLNATKVVRKASWAGKGTAYQVIGDQVLVPGLDFSPAVVSTMPWWRASLRPSSPNGCIIAVTERDVKQ